MNMKSGVTKTLVLAGLAVCSLTACDNEPAKITHGTVTAKQYIAASTHTDMIPIYGCSPVFDSNGNMSCNNTIISWTSEEVNDPECWELSLTSGDLKGKVCVTKEQYDAAWVGSYHEESHN